MYDEPNYPSTQKYEKGRTKKWSASVADADAYVFVTPEYNFGPPPSFINALNYVYREWNYKPCSFVSYGGVSGTRPPFAPTTVRSSQAVRSWPGRSSTAYATS